MPTAQIGIQTSFNNVGTAAADVALGRVGVTASKAERELAAYARTVAQAQRAMGNTPGAIQTYEAALNQLNGTTKESLALQRQLATLRRADLGPALPRTLEAFGGEALNQLKSGLLNVVGPAALATAALKAIPAAIDLAQLGAQAELVRIRFDALAKSAGISGDALLAALRKGSGREISDLNLQLAANKAQLLGVAHSAEEFGILMSIARDRAQQMGITTTQAFDDLVTGLGRGSKLILDNLGILVNADQANQAYARSIGKTVTQLTDQERKQALINQVIKDGQASLQATGGAADTAASGQARLSASWDNVKASVGSALADGVAPFINSLSDLINASDGTKEGLGSLINGLIDFNRQITGLPPLTAAQTKAQQDWTRSVQDWIIAREVQLGLMAASPVNSGGGGSFEFADVALARQVTEAQLGYANALAMTGIQQRAAALAADQKATADKVASIDAQTHAIAQEKLAKQAQEAAQALIKAGPAGANTANILAQSSSQVDVLTAAYYRLALAQGSTAKGATQQDAANFRSLELFGKTADQTNAAIQKQIAADNARSAGILQNGTHLQKLAELQRLYNDAVRQSGKDSAQAITAQNALVAEQQKISKQRVSSAANTALQLANLEENSGAQLLKIQRENQERLADQEQDYQLNRARKQEDFQEKYQSLLAHGQRAEAARAKAEFEKDQRRDAQDRAIQLRRTLRNNAESIGDTTGAAERRSGQIQDRAALRGGAASSGPIANAPIPAAPARGGGATFGLHIQFQPFTFAVDGKKVLDIFIPDILEQVDTSLADEFGQLGITISPSGGQVAVAGA